MAMLHSALEEAKAAQRGSATRQQEVQHQPSGSMQQMQQDQQQHQLGQQTVQPLQESGTRLQHMMRRDVTFTQPGAPIAIDPSVETAQAEMVQLQNTLQVLREQTMADHSASAHAGYG